MEALVSIVVPIFKVEQYLCRCVDSLLRQDYQRIEIILVDDGSPDRCGDICDDYARRDSRIRVIHQVNAGLSAARNSGIEIASGDYLMFVDSDDFVESNYCSYALSESLKYNSDIVVFGYNVIYFDRIESQSVDVENEKRFSKEEALVELNGGKILSFAWNKIYKASLFESVRYPVGRLYEDIGTTYLLFDKANSVYLASGITYNYQKRNDSILGKKMTAKDAIDWFDMVRQRHEYIACKYPKIISQIASSDVHSVMYCLTNLYCFLGYKQKRQEMVRFILELSVYPIKNKSIYLRLLLFSPMLFRMEQNLKRYIKIIVSFMK